MLAMILFSSGCQMFGHEPAPPLLQVYHLSVSMEPYSNPDATGVALPLKIRLFRLKQSSAFMSEDFFTLQSDRAAAPNDEFIGQQQIFLRPGQKPVSLRIDRTGELRFIGIVAEYQQLDGKRWRQVIALPEPVPPTGSFFSSLFTAPPTSQNTDIRIVATPRGLNSVVVPAEND